jgi:hypothetical protein
MAPPGAGSVHFERQCRQLYWGVAISLLFVVAAAVLQMVFLHRQVTLRVADASQNMARNLQLSIDQMLDTVNISMLAATDEISHEDEQNQLDPRYLNFQLIRISNRLPHVKIQATDEQGILLYNIDVASQVVDDIDVTERDYYQAALADSTGGLYIGPPVFSTSSNSWVREFSRSARSRSGRFLGVVHARIDTSGLQKMLDALHLEPGATVSMRDRNLLLIARRLAGSAAFPMEPGTATVSPQMRQAIQTDPMQGSYTSAETRIDAAKRYFSYARSDKFGFVVNVGVTGASAFAEWRNQAWITGVLVTLFALTAYLAAVLIVRSWRHQEASMQALAAAQAATASSNRLLEQALEMARCGTWTQDLVAEPEQPRLSPRLLQLMGVPTGTEATRPAAPWPWCAVDVAGAERVTEVRQLYRDAAMGRQDRYETRYPVQSQGDGAVRWFHDIATVTRNDEGQPVFMQGLCGTSAWNARRSRPSCWPCKALRRPAAPRATFWPI